MANISPELAKLLERRRKLAKAHGDAQTAADELGLALKHDGAAAPARNSDLARLESAADEALASVDECDYAIAKFPSRTVADVAVKARIIATEIEGLSLGPAADLDSSDTIDRAFMRGLALDLNRLAAQ